MGKGLLNTWPELWDTASPASSQSFALTPGGAQLTEGGQLLIAWDLGQTMTSFEVPKRSLL